MVTVNMPFISWLDLFSVLPSYVIQTSYSKCLIFGPIYQEIDFKERV